MGNLQDACPHNARVGWGRGLMNTLGVSTWYTNTGIRSIQSSLFVIRTGIAQRNEMREVPHEIGHDLAA